MAEAILARTGPLEAVRSTAISGLPSMIRLSFRGGDASREAIGAAFGVTPGTMACRAAEADHRAADHRAALWLGPDEWLLIAPDGDAAALTAVLSGAAGVEPHSLVDVSHRNTGFSLVGNGVADLLNEGCPLDLHLAAFPVGMCTRTVLGKAEIVLWRRAPDAFHVDCWRSFAPYVRAFLSQAADNRA